MTRLTRYLKPYLPMVLLAVVLLFVQANADLALPDYLSKIVNIGIQQSGVERVLPVAIRQSEMARLAIFLNADDRADLLNQYTLVTEDAADYAKFVELYPALEKEPVYVAGVIDKATIDQLGPALGRAWMAVSGIEQMIADPTKAAEMGAATGFDLTKIPPGMDVFTLLGQMPAAQLAQMTEAMSGRFAALGDSMITQAAIRAVKAEY
ncbi:MAG: ABC transporter ATP-binding protein, partial [Anaerolineae bacterium]|nr:ABC transporter ATP-binding protein [Anaerolineae bacterium]